MDCKADIKGGCEADCKTEEGALFCDSQYVDHGDNLNECINALEAVLTTEVDGYASGSASCEGGTCKSEGEAGVSCSALPMSTGGSALWGLPLLGLVAFRRRRRS